MAPNSGRASRNSYGTKYTAAAVANRAPSGSQTDRASHHNPHHYNHNLYKWAPFCGISIWKRWIFYTKTFHSSRKYKIKINFTTKLFTPQILNHNLYLLSSSSI